MLDFRGRDFVCVAVRLLGLSLAVVWRWNGFAASTVGTQSDDGFEVVEDADALFDREIWRKRSGGGVLEVDFEHDGPVCRVRCIVVLAEESGGECRRRGVG